MHKNKKEVGRFCLLLKKIKKFERQNAGVIFSLTLVTLFMGALLLIQIYG